MSPVREASAMFGQLGSSNWAVAMWGSEPQDESLLFNGVTSISTEMARKGRITWSPVAEAPVIGIFDVGIRGGAIYWKRNSLLSLWRVPTCSCVAFRLDKEMFLPSVGF